MSGTSPPAVPVWKTDGPPSPGKGRRSLLLFVLLGLIAVFGIFIGLLYWLSPPIEPSILPVVIAMEPSGHTVPWMEEDRLALSEGGWLGRPRDDWAANPNRDQIRLRFRALANVPRSQPVVVYLASPAAVDAAGGVFLLPADRLGDHPRNRLPLTELLAAFHDCPAHHRLLILDLIPPTEDPLFASSRGDLSRAVFQTLDDSSDPGRSCLVACSPGQVPTASPELGRTVFGWYLEAGLRGEADGWAGDSPDGRVSINELAAFVREKTSRWVTATRGDVQTPQLVGSATDFTLRALTRTQTENEKTETAFPYPEWLRKGWEQHDQWQRDGRAGASPWAFRKLRSVLLTAEKDYLAGKPIATIQRDLDNQLLAAEQLATSLAAAPTPDPLPTLAALYPGYVLPDPAILTELRDAARRLDSRPPAPAPAPGEKATPEPLVPPEFDPFKARPHPTLALAAFLLLTDDPDPTPARIRGLAQLLATQTPTPRFAETALIQRLANLAAQAPAVPWSSERAALALQTARLLEGTINPVLFAWASPAIESAYRLRSTAEAVYFAPGFASTTEASQRLRDAAGTARHLKETADRLRMAHAAWHETTAWLMGSTEAVQTGTIPFSVAEQLAETAQKLGDTLELPATPLDLDAFATRGSEWDNQTNTVRTAIAEFARPFRGDAVAKLRARAESPEAGPSVVRELDILLATPLLLAADRSNLWNARAALARRLADEALRNDVTNREAIQKGLASRPFINPREPANELTTDPGAVRKRIQWTLALLRVGGLEKSTLATLQSDLDNLVGDRFAFADRLRRVWIEDAPAKLANISGNRAERLACVLPIAPATAILDSPGTNPATLAHRSAARAMWMWQAGRFEYESRELSGDDAALSFALGAARACRAATGPKAELYLEVTPAALPKLTPDHPDTSLRMNFRAVGGDEPTHVHISTLSPSENWVKVGSPPDITLDPLRQGSTEFSLSAGDNPVTFPGALGVLVEAQASGRTYHRRVPVSLDEITDRLNLLVRTAPGQPPIISQEIRIRPNGTVQPYQLLLANPAPRERKVVVKLVGLNRETDVIAVAPGKTATLAFPGPPPVPLPPGQAGQQPLPDEGLLVKGDELVLQLFDPTDRETVRQTIRIPIAVTHPADYLRVTDPIFRPSVGSRPNHLSASIVPGNIPPGGPCTVRLGFPPERNRDLVVRDGSMTGSVERGGPPLSLYADNLALPHLSGSNVCVTISADGMERVATYLASLPSVGESLRLTAEGTPQVRVNVAPVATGTEPLPVTLEVDNAPPGATLEFLIGTAVDKKSPIVADLTMPIPTAKEIAAHVKFDPKGETFLLTGSIKDHAPKLPVELLVGRRVLEARLLDRAGNKLATHRADVIFDGTPPQNVHFTDLPSRARKDQPLMARATCDPTISGIKEVKFFFGQPQKNELPKSPPPIAGKLFDEKMNEWRATLPVDGHKGFVTVGVQFTTNAGLSSIETQEVELLDPAELNKPEPGNIAGKLMEGRLPQPGLVVFLYDDKGNAKAKTTTNPDGLFEFRDLVPGSYYLFSVKESTNRHIKKEVVVKPGDTLMVTLELLLK
jgi:hypothetical protein